MRVARKMDLCEAQRDKLEGRARSRTATVRLASRANRAVCRMRGNRSYLQDRDGATLEAIRNALVGKRSKRNLRLQVLSDERALAGILGGTCRLLNQTLTNLLHGDRPQFHRPPGHPATRSVATGH